MDQNQPEREEREQRLLRLHRARWQFAYPMLALAFVFLFSTILQSTADSIIRMTVPTVASADWYPWVLSMLPMYLCAMPISLLIFRLCDTDLPNEKRLGGGVWWGLLAICFALTYAGNLIGSIVNVVLSFLTGTSIVNPLASMTLSSPLWVNLLFVGILAPIMEEIFYRKLLIDRWRRYGDLAAVLLSSLVFGLIHGNFSQFFYAFAVGFLFGLVYVQTGRIRYTVLLHMAINLIGGVYTTEMMKLLAPSLAAQNPVEALLHNPAGMLMLLGYLVFLLAAIVGAVAAVILFFRQRREPLARAKEPMQPAEWKEVLLLNPGVWMLGFVVLLMFLL